MKERTLLTERTLLVAAGGAPPLIILLGALLAGPGFPVVTAIGITGVWYAALFAALSETRSTALAGGVVLALDEEPRLDLVEEIGNHPSMAITAVADSGVCPLGFRTGQTWAVNDVGRLTRPLCLPARAAIQATFGEAGTRGIAQGLEVACRCPLPSRSVVFSLRGEDGLANRQPLKERTAPAI